MSRSKLNNLILKYESERDRLKIDPHPGWSVRLRLKTIDEVIRSLLSLRG